MRSSILGVLVAAAAALGAVASAADRPVAGDLLHLRDPARPARRAVRFRAARDPALAAGTGADPRAGAVLEIAGEGPGDGLTGPIALEASRWRGLGHPRGSRGFRYLDRAASTGIRRVVLRTGRHRGTLIVRGGGRAWPYRIAQAQDTVDVRLRVGSELYCARFEPTSFRRNRTGRVLARRAPAPDDCGGGTPPAGCGNGTLDGAEECDDGNTTSLDGCAADCQLEDTSAVCAGVPAAAGTAIAVERVGAASGFDKPVHLTAPRLDPSRLYVVLQRGRIRVVRNGVLLPDPFLDLSGKVSCCGERGLLSLSFHPAFETNGRFFVYYTDAAGALVIARYETGASPDVADPASEKILLTIPHASFENHNGGLTAFGPDGFLYIGVGDGGGGGDPSKNAQNGASLLGKLLRLDVDVDAPPYYAIPPTNPFVAGAPRDEIWALGLRNPWRFDFDRATGDLYIADVGQDAFEEIDFQPAASPGGENYGWDVFEGNGHCFEGDPECAAPGNFVMPVHEYPNTGFGNDCSVTGGFAYRGCALPALHGTYFYGDFCSAFVRSFRLAGGVATEHADHTAALAPGGGLAIDRISSFGEDARGEIYILDYDDGDVFRIVPAS